MEPNEIYQFSLLNALMSGVSESGITVSTLLSKNCNHGLGTFSRMDGELVLLDSKVYQLQSQGHVREAQPTDQIPFGMATNFVPQKTLSNVHLAKKSDVDRELDAFDDHAQNLFMTYRVEGSFAYVKCRTVRGQEFPGESLKELGARQSVEEYENVEGTVLGFRSPENWQGFSVAGEHMHFISADRKKGGHVLELASDRGGGEGVGVTMHMAVNNHVHIELPKSRDFNSANLVTDDEGVRQVEG